MPADIVGTNIIAEDERASDDFRFQPGPIFANLVLADEINRATPKTQSALLEAMQEHRGHRRQDAVHADRAVLRAGHPEPAGDGGHLPAARGAARPLLLQARRALPDRGGADRDPGAHDRRPRGSPSSASRDGADILRDAGAGARRAVAEPRDATTRSGSCAPPTRTAESPPELVRKYVRYGGSPARRAGDGAGRQDPRAARRALQRRLRGRARRRAARAAPPRHPQLRGRGRGDQQRQRGPRHHRRDAHRLGRSRRPA